MNQFEDMFKTENPYYPQVVKAADVVRNAPICLAGSSPDNIGRGLTHPRIYIDPADTVLLPRSQSSNCRMPFLEPVAKRSAIIPHNGLSRVLHYGPDVLARALCMTFDAIYSSFINDPDALAKYHSIKRYEFVSTVLDEYVLCFGVTLDDECNYCGQLGRICPNCADKVNFACLLDEVCRLISDGFIFNSLVLDMYSSGNTIHVEAISPTDILVKEM